MATYSNYDYWGGVIEAQQQDIKWETVEMEWGNNFDLNSKGTDDIFLYPSQGNSSYDAYGFILTNQETSGYALAFKAFHHPLQRINPGPDGELTENWIKFYDQLAIANLGFDLIRKSVKKIACTSSFVNHASFAQALNP